MRGILDKFGKLTQKQSESLNNEPNRLYCRSPLPSSPITATKAVQTDFPVAMLESYVVKNKKRILALLNIPHDSASSLCSMPGKFKKTDQFDCPKSWTTIPYADDRVTSTAVTFPSPRPNSKEIEKLPLLNSSADTPDVVKEDPDTNVYGVFHGGKRCSEGDIARQTCLVPLLSNGTSCSLVNERKMAITDF